MFNYPFQNIVTSMDNEAGLPCTAKQSVHCTTKWAPFIQATMSMAFPGLVK